MWMVIKYKKNQLEILKKNLSNTLRENLEIYIPKISYNKYFYNKIKHFEKPLLGDYFLCFHKKFLQNDIVNNIKYLRGLNCILTGFKNDQKDICKFIKYCKSHEDSDGFLKQSFFELANQKKIQFLSGPFASLIFQILSKDKNKLKILIGNVTTTIGSKSEYLYQPIK